METSSSQAARSACSCISESLFVDTLARVAEESGDSSDVSLDSRNKLPFKTENWSQMTQIKFLSGLDGLNANLIVFENQNIESRFVYLLLPRRPSTADRRLQMLGKCNCSMSEAWKSKFVASLPSITLIKLRHYLPHVHS